MPYTDTINSGMVTDHSYSDLVAVPAIVPEEALAAFIGENPNGVWTLTVYDDLAGADRLAAGTHRTTQSTRAVVEHFAKAIAT